MKTKKDTLVLDLDTIPGCMFTEFCLDKTSTLEPSLATLTKAAHRALEEGRSVEFISTRRRIIRRKCYYAPSFKMACCDDGKMHSFEAEELYDTAWPNITARIRHYLKVEYLPQGEKWTITIRPYDINHVIGTVMADMEYWIRDVSLELKPGDYIKPNTKIKPLFYVRRQLIYRGNGTDCRVIRMELTDDNKWWWISGKEYIDFVNGDDMAKKTREMIASGNFTLPSTS